MKKSDIRDRIKRHGRVAADAAADIPVLAHLAAPQPQPAPERHSQQTILRNVNLYTREKAFDMALPDGPFRVAYTRNGANALVTSSAGYAAAFNTQSLKLRFETHTHEPIRDACWLHNELFFAAAQETALYIYNQDGCEQHAVRQLSAPRQMAFLPYHFLLACATANARLKYLDTTCGTVAADLFVADKAPTALAVSPTNGVVHLGNTAGVVSLWAPTAPEALMHVKCHTAAVTGVAFSRDGMRMVSTGLDRRLCVFDTRETYKPLHATPLRRAATQMALSARGMVAVAQGRRVCVFRGAEAGVREGDAYISERVRGDVQSLAFCPHEDILAVGHGGGISALVVPGCADPEYDCSEASPFESKHQRQENEVRRLLERVPFELIGLESPLLGRTAPEVVRPRVAERYYDGGREERRALFRFERRQRREDV